MEAKELSGLVKYHADHDLGMIECLLPPGFMESARLIYRLGFTAGVAVGIKDAVLELKK